MKLIPSPLVASLKGRAAGAVGVVWRGVNYIRKWNPAPANPKTAAQQEVRASLSHLVNIWKHAPDNLETAWKAFAEGLPRAGVHCFYSANVALQKADTWLACTPSEPAENPMGALTLSMGADQAKATWDALDATPTDLCHEMVWKDVHPASLAAVDEADAIPVTNADSAISVGALSYTFSGLESGTDYLFGLVPKNATTGAFALCTLAKGSTT